MKIYFEEGQAVSDNVRIEMERAAKHCLKINEIPDNGVEISVTFVKADQIKDLNKTYRNIDKVTDVLSFPQFTCAEEIVQFSNQEDISLGDVVICIEKAEEQAALFGHSFEREVLYLFVHSVLHLLGYDHMDDEEKKEMRCCEEEVMSFLGVTRD